MITENYFNFKDVGKQCVKGNVEGVVAYYIITVAKSYTIYGANGIPVLATLEAGTYPGGVTRFMAADGVSEVADGEIIIALNA